MPTHSSDTENMTLECLTRLGFPLTENCRWGLAYKNVDWSRLVTLVSYTGSQAKFFFVAFYSFAAWIFAMSVFCDNSQAPLFCVSFIRTLLPYWWNPNKNTRKTIFAYAHGPCWFQWVPEWVPGFQMFCAKLTPCLQPCRPPCMENTRRGV